MKVRCGFVSNSSSSSFIVFFDKKPESVDELENILYDSFEILYNGDTFLSSELASEVFYSLEVCDFKKLKELEYNHFNFYNGVWYNKGYYYEQKDLDEYVVKFNKLKYEMEGIRDILSNFDKKNIERLKKLTNILDEENKTLAEYECLEKRYWQIYKRQNNLMNKIVEKSAKKILEDNKNRFIMTCEFGDDTNMGSCLEHNDTFTNLDYMKISNH